MVKPMSFCRVLLVALAWLLTLIPTKSFADVPSYFFEVNCDPASDSFLIREFMMDNTGGEELALAQASKLKKPPHPNGTYFTLGLATRDKHGNFIGTKPFKTACRLSSGTFTAEIDPSNFPSATGMCMGGEASLSLTLKHGRHVIAQDLVFDESCYRVEGTIESVFISGPANGIVVSAHYKTENFEDIPFKKVFSLTDKTQLSHDVLISNDHSLALLVAVVEGLNDKIPSLLTKGADVNTSDALGQTPLMWAAKRWDAELVELFLKHGANPNAKDEEGETAFAWGLYVPSTYSGELRYDQEKTLRALIKGGADVNAKDNEGRSILALAIKSENQELIDFLKKLGAKQ